MIANAKANANDRRVRAGLGVLLRGFEDHRAMRAVAIALWAMLPWLVMGEAGCRAPAAGASAPGGRAGPGEQRDGQGRASGQATAGRRTQAGRDGAAGTQDPEQDRAAGGQGAPAERGLELPLDGVACAAQACAYHAGREGYFLCLNGAAGRCFHYGRSCAPADGCMYEARSGTYRSCEQAAEGQCVRFGAACDPPERCMFDRASGLYRTCTQGERGRCDGFGDVCGPR